MSDVNIEVLDLELAQGKYLEFDSKEDEKWYQRWLDSLEDQDERQD